MIEPGGRARLSAFQTLSLPVKPHTEDRWLVRKKLVAFALIVVFGAWAVSAAESLRGGDMTWSEALGMFGVVVGALGVVYVSGFASAYRLPRDQQQIVGVGFTPEGMVDALFSTTSLPRPVFPVTTAAFVTATDVLVRLGGQTFNLTRSDLYDVKVGVAGKRIWLLIAVGQQEYPLRLRGPVRGEIAGRSPSVLDGEENGP